MNEFSYDVFLSHNAKDKPRVRRLAERLKEAGLRVWFDEWIAQSGDIIIEKVDRGLEQSRALILCISPNALASGWVALERSSAIHRDPAIEGPSLHSAAACRLRTPGQSAPLQVRGEGTDLRAILRRRGRLEPSLDHLITR
jgi:hypothetical protein